MFLDEPPATPGRDRLYQADRDGSGYVDNLTRLWAWRADVAEAFTAVRGRLQDAWALTDIDRAVLVVATARARGDSYCSLAWGGFLAELAGAEVAAQLIAGGVDALDDRPRALAAWADAVVRDPNATTPADIAALHAVGLSDRAIFEATAFVAFRLAFSTVNDALGAEPDAQLAQSVPGVVRDAVTFGRAPATAPSC
jgi:uncharacterized peroxidase-related enzyme